MNKRLVIAGTNSGAGKTTVTLGLMAALRRQGMNVQGFKCGPDYIDPSYHTALTGRPSRNLDSWMLERSQLLEVMQRGMEGADIGIIEGVMGFYDGKDPESNAGSTADISMLTDSPVLLVVNCAAMARSAAAVVKGFQLLDPNVPIKGVIANNVGSEGHAELIETAVQQECGIPVVGWLKQNPDVTLPERHLGLIPALERGELDGFFEQLADAVTASFDLEQIKELAEAPPLLVPSPSLFREPEKASVVTAVAKDEAFSFYYPENLELLEQAGSRIAFFSPLKGEPLPADADGLYIGGGFPEEFTEQLAEEGTSAASISRAVENGMPVLAECGGFMYLTESITKPDGSVHPMLGLIPGKVTFTKRLAALGYRESTPDSSNALLTSPAKGHEFRYSTYEPGHESPAWHLDGRFGSGPDGFASETITAGFVHLHFGSNPELAANWVSMLQQYQSRKKSD
ncbi:cobyrinate a,c-diamide synthase [Alkalicoccus luteus]|uniref:cobyrinate a,c-diamide synthase n=1 Tax=Alkalicoccus luteus TaxID=1237094 RepID=UPI004033B1A9